MLAAAFPNVGIGLFIEKALDQLYAEIQRVQPSAQAAAVIQASFQGP